MRTVLLAIIAAIGGVFYASPQADDVSNSVIRSVSYADPEAGPACNCKSGGECNCVDCDCEGCPCGKPTVKESLTVEGRAVAVDPVTGIAVGGPSIIQFSTQGCLPCVRWELEEKPKYLRQGWEVPAPVYGTVAPAYPSFRVYDGKRWHAHTGWLSGADVRRMLGGAVSSSSPRVSAGAAMVSAPAAAASGRDWLIGGQPWTRQGLINHLATHSSHGHSRAQLQAMSFGQLNALHNADHESQRSPMRSTVMSGCPGGSCPPARSVPARRGFFGGRW